MMPVKLIKSFHCASAFEKAVCHVFYHGIDSQNHYEKESSREATVMITIYDPLQEPRIHERDKHGKEKLKEYVKTVLEGTENHLIGNMFDYTYNDRMFKWGRMDENYKKQNKPYVQLFQESTIGFKKIVEIKTEWFDQVEKVIKMMKEQDFSRKLQVTTWIPPTDLDIDTGSPCLQRIWFRVLQDKNDKKNLIMNTHWRSRDLYRAWSINTYAMCEFGKQIAKELGFSFVQYNDISDSLHLYGSVLSEVKEFLSTNMSDRKVNLNEVDR